MRVIVNQQMEDSTIRPGQTARFRDLIVWWADRLGRHQVPLRDKFDDINDLLSPDAVHHELIQEIVRKVYCLNRCGHLNAAITLEDTFTALGRVREKLLKSMRSDVDQIDLLDNIGWYTRQYFGPLQAEPGVSGTIRESVDANPLDQDLRASS